MHGMNAWVHPRVINTDKAPTYSAAMAALKEEGTCPPTTGHRQVKYRNNIVEADHGKLKRLINPTLGFQPLKGRPMPRSKASRSCVHLENTNIRAGAWSTRSEETCA